MNKTKIAEHQASILLSIKLKEEAKQAKKLFDLCEEFGENIHGKLHILENSQYPNEKTEYRIYHADGYCFDVSREEIDLAEGEMCDSMIGCYEYYFNEGYEGFKEITVGEAIKLFTK